jgi:hypothetical protein
VDAITAVGGSDALIVKLRELEARRDAIPETTIVLPDRAAILTACRKTAMQLSEALTRDVPLARQALADLFGPITISMADERTILEFEQPVEGFRVVSRTGSGGAISHQETD